MIRAWLAGKDLRVVGDQTGTPTYTADLARVLVDLIHKDPERGFYHTAGPDIVTWHQFATEAITAYAKHAGSDKPVEITPIKTEDWPTPARRPKYSALSFEKVSGLRIEPMRHLPEALTEFAGAVEV